MIEFEEAGFSYGARTVLSGVSLSLIPGAFHFLIGFAGAGKTTLLRLCYLDLVPTVGTVRHFGRAIGARDRNAIARLRRSVGVVQEECHLIDHLSLAENVALPLSVSGIAPEERADDVAALLAWVELGHRARALPGELDRGERRRAALARAVILSPEVILADEPTGGVDATTARGLMTLLRRAQPHGQDRAGRHPRRERSRTRCGAAVVLRLEDGRVWADEEAAA